MISAMRVTNGVLIILFCLGAVVSVFTDFKGGAYGIGQLIGFALWIAPLYLARRGLMPDSEASTVKKAFRANIALSILVTALIITLSALSRQGSLILGFLLLLAPYALNVIALDRKKKHPNQKPFPQSPGLTESSDQSSESAVTSSEAPDQPRKVKAVGDTTFAQGSARKANYVLRHWRGDLPLGLAYWINGGLISGVGASLLMGFVAKIDDAKSYSLQTMSALYVLAIFCWLAAWGWSIVGIWRSADAHTQRGGNSSWASIAKGMVILGALSVGVKLSENIVPQVKELGLIALGKDPMGKVSVRVSSDGKSVLVVGALGQGSALEIERILDAAPSAKTLVLNSPGGRLREAQQVAQAVRNRQLNTYVEHQCASACTFVFLAGQDRAATPNALIGFHQPSFPGLDDVAQANMVNAMLDVYRSAGISEDFLKRVAATRAEEMWYPNRDEMIGAGVVNRISLGGEAALASYDSKQEFLAAFGREPLFQAIERRFPGTIEEASSRAWAAKQAGGSDSDITNASRTIVSEIYPKLLKTADDDVLNQFSILMADELSAALQVSSEACAKLLSGKLDITKTLPKEMVKRETDWTMKALAAGERADEGLFDPKMAQELLEVAMETIPSNYLPVISDMSAYADQPELTCNAMISFFQAINSVPSPNRSIILRGMYQGDG